MTTLGIIGAGHIGSQVARAAIAQGYDVVISNSRGPETLSALVADLGPQARAATAAEAGAAGDVVVVTVPFGKYTRVPVEPLAGKIVLDTNNYYFERDGHFHELDRGEATVSGLLQQHLPTSKVVKAFNHIGAREIPTTGAAAGTPDRRALATASDHPDAVAWVTDVLRRDRVRHRRHQPAQRVVARRARPARIRGAAERRRTAREPGEGSAHDLTPGRR